MSPRRHRALLALALALGIVLGSASGASAQGSGWWRLNATAAPTLLPRGGAGRAGEGQIVISATNLGDGEVNATSEPVTLTDVLPKGAEPVAADGVDKSVSCRAISGPEVACTFEGTLPPGGVVSADITVHMNVSDPTVSTLPNVVTVTGGEEPGGGEIPSPGPLERPLQLQRTGGESTPFGVQSFEQVPESAGGEGEASAAGALDTQAGSHPFQLTTTLDLNQTLDEYIHSGPEPHEGILPSAAALPDELHFKLPPGLVASITAVPRCTDTQFSTPRSNSEANQCPANTAIGFVSVLANIPATAEAYRQSYFLTPLFNLTPQRGEPARLGFWVSGLRVPVVLNTALLSGGDYAAEVSVVNTDQGAQLLSSQVTVWGVPGDPRHDPMRGWECLDPELGFPCIPEGQTHPAPFLTLPTACDQQLTTTVSGRSWPTGEPGNEGEPLAPEHTTYTLPATLTGCNTLEFNPSLTLEPEQRSASTPTGLNATVTMPQRGLSTPGGRAESALKETTVTLPPGIQLNPSAANGLEACSAAVGEFDFLNVLERPFEGAEEEAQTGNETSPSGPPNCPDAAKIGTVSIKTPLLANVLTGWVYLAKQNTSPFKSPLAVYLTAEEPETGVLVKLAGEVKTDPETGQLTSTFKNTPQLPFSELQLHFFGGERGEGGERAPLATPPTCGPAITNATFTPWSPEQAKAAYAQSTPSFQIATGPGGGPCPGTPLPFGPSFQAGVSNPQAGALTPFTLTIGQADGAQPLEKIDLHLPPGIAALIADVTPCPEAQALADRCGPESLVGHTTAVSGLGNEPVTLGGQVYLTGALKEGGGHPAAPFGLLAVTHAAAGPFDLGDVNVLSRLEIDPNTAVVSVQSEPIPKLVKGVPVDLKQLVVTVERPGNAPFEFNPTNCNPMSITGALSGYEGASVPVSYPFQVQNCATLPFAPTLTAEAGGHGSKANGTSLTVKVRSAGVGQANIAKVELTFPQALPSRLSTIQQACVASVFERDPAACDEGSVIGEATVHTPVLSSPLSGPGYLVSHGGAAFPDVEFVLQGEGITIVLDGKTDIKKGITYSKFESAPDVPFTTFETQLPAGPHSAFTANVPEKEDFSLCKTSLTMPTTITGQNGAVIEQSTAVAISGCGGVKAFKASKLEEALKACKKKYRKKSKRLACEKQARKRYAARKASKSARRK